MNRSTNPCTRHRFPSAIIRYTFWLCPRFSLSHRDIEDLLAGRAHRIESAVPAGLLYGATAARHRITLNGMPRRSQKDRTWPRKN